jgi:hypothetical protein
MEKRSTTDSCPGFYTSHEQYMTFSRVSKQNPKNDKLDEIPVEEWMQDHPLPWQGKFPG